MITENTKIYVLKKSLNNVEKSQQLSTISVSDITENKKEYKYVIITKHINKNMYQAYAFFKKRHIIIIIIRSNKKYNLLTPNIYNKLRKTIKINPM